MFSDSSVLLQFGYCAMLGAALARKPVLRRLLIAFTAVMFGLRAALPPLDAITLGWMAIIIVVCALLVWRPFARNAVVTFTSEESDLRAAIFDALPASEARHLMTQGWWVNGAAGEPLTKQGKPIESLVFLASGSARVIVNEQQVGTCDSGDLIGEATALTGTPATATVVLSGPARLWCIKSATLRDYLAANPEITPTLERSFRNALRAKLVASNQAMARGQSTG